MSNINIRGDETKKVMNDGSIKEYLQIIKKRFQSGISTEHSYRGDLLSLINSLVSGVTVTNEPKRQKCGAPDYILQRKEIPLGYIEAKDIGVDLDKTEKTDQIKRYLESLSNLIVTDYLDFRFFQYGQKVKEIKLASIKNDKFFVHSENFENFLTYIQNFCQFKGQTITSTVKLAEMMAKKAKMMKEVFFNAVLEEDEHNTLQDQFLAFKQILMHDLDEKTFADIYAQTITYGLFAARLHDPTLQTFSRQEASELIPKSNPFLRSLFSYVSGVELDERVRWIVDDLADIFQATDLNAITADFGKLTGQTDPFLHFYEHFLAAYDPALRKSKGVYYTPEPVVNFIVRAVDDILKSEFNLPAGLADTSKISIEITDNTSKKKEIREVHKVQFLDPATGTGTFLAEIVKQIYKQFEGQEGIWSNYVEEHLIPRLNGFEILMAPYTMCHLKLESLLRDTGYHPKDEKKQKRLQVYLTNSLEEAHPDSGTLFASWLSRESIEANYIKKETPVMVVLGNPPYSVSSSNKGEWIQNLIADYKKDLHEKNIQPLSDDYIKFIRYGQYLIEKNHSGILAFISNNSFIDGLIHRQMRKALLESFDKILILNLHGSSKKKETTQDGSNDENVFDIQQGVSISFFVKYKSEIKNNAPIVRYLDLWGNRAKKYNFLNQTLLNSLEWKVIEPTEPNYFFIIKNFSLESQYCQGFSVKELFKLATSGIKTHDDAHLVSFCPFSDTNFCYYYRPFDIRYICYDLKKVKRHRFSIMKNITDKENLLLILPRITRGNRGFEHGLISKYLSDVSCGDAFSGAGTFLFPLYIYPDDQFETNRVPNFNTNIINQITQILKVDFSWDGDFSDANFSPINLLDYIYAFVYSPSYREKYKEFLKIDFPRVPYPENTEIFWQLVKLGGELRQIHLLESSVVDHFITKFPIGGNNLVKKITHDLGKVWINDTQFFDCVPEIAWNFYIGGYQPAQKWLKDRKGRELTFDDICHYQKIIVALSETDRIMKEIDKVITF